MRTFNGRSSEELFNSKMYELYEVIRNIIDIPEDQDIGPVTSKDGALWLDRLNGELKYKNGSNWENIFEDKFRMISEILSPEEPHAPVSGQLWLDNGILTYFTGSEWVPAKSVNVATEFNLSAFEQFLIINPISAAGKLVVNQNNENASKLKKIYLEESFITQTVEKEYVLVKGKYSLDTGALNVYVNGRRLPIECVKEVNETTVRIEGFVDIDGVAQVNSMFQVVIDYINKESMAVLQKVEFGTSYVQMIDAKKGQKDFDLEKSFVPEQNQLSLFLNGRKLTKDGFTEVGNKAFSLTMPLIEDATIEANIVYFSIRDNDGTLKDLGEFLEPSDTATQFLVPSVALDKFFINGFHTSNYKEISDVAIEYPSIDLQGKVASAVHVSPKKLVNIKKKLFAINKENPIIPVSENNTEFYGIKDGVGKLLLKSKIEPEYTTAPIGIKLSNTAAFFYDFIQSITYEFKNLKGKGTLVKNKVMLSDTSSVYVGEISDPLCVFIQGLHLEESPSNYTFEDGYVKIAMETKMDVGIISFPQKETGDITELDINGDGIVNISKIYNKILVFVSGEGIDYSLADYTIDSTNDKIIYVKGAKPGMKYSIVETKTSDGVEDMFFKSGIVEKDRYTNEYYINIEEEVALNKITKDDGVILFINGILISKKDVQIEYENNRIVVTGGVNGGLYAGLNYIVLKDSSNRFIFSDDISFNTIPLGHFSDATMVYIENQLATDASAVQVSTLPKLGYINEIKQLITNTSQDWYIRTTNGWEKITIKESTDKLNSTAANYVCDGHSIGIFQNFGQKECIYYSYQYDNAIEKPLLRGNINTTKEKNIYKTAFNHYLPSNRNALSVWQNGLRQYPDTTGDPNAFDGYFELGNSSFKMPTNKNADGINEYIDGGMFYVVEQPEKLEIKSCERQVLRIENLIEGSNNSFRTDISLFPGNVKVYISGIRQPNTAFRVLDTYTISIDDDLLIYPDNYPSEDIEINNKSITINRIHPDSILVEVRQDSLLKEICIPVRYKQQNAFTIEPVNKSDKLLGGDGIPESIMDSKDFIMIYVNGLAYGKNYKIENNTIYLMNEDITKSLGCDAIYDYFQENPDAYDKWRLENNGMEYTPKKITDKIIFEWR